MRVLITGDVHEKHAEYLALVERARERLGIEAAIQTGDFGFFRDTVARSFGSGVRFPVPVYVIDGNHEDHAWLDHAVRRRVVDRWREEHNLYYQPRASLVRLGSSAVGFLGGALHVDRPQYRHWYRRVANFILAHESERAIDLFNREQPALVVTHSCPADIGIGLRGNPDFDGWVREHILGAGFNPGSPGDCGERELTALWWRLAYRPQAWCFGHFHVCHDVSIEGTRFVCTGTVEDCPGVVWDSETRSLQHAPDV